MEDNLKKLRKEITKKKNELDLAISTNASVEEIHYKSILIDVAISMFLRASQKYGSENNKFMGKYKKILEKDYKNEIIKLIELDVKDKFKDYIKEELNHFCENVYVLCTLKANNVEEEEIIKQMMYRNNVFYCEMEQQGKDIKKENSKISLNFYTKLKNKYIKIIKERM